MDEQNGDFFVFINEGKKPGDRQPAFTGKISKPGSDEKFPVSLWVATYSDTETGEEKLRYYGLIDVVSTDADAADQVKALAAATRGHDQTMGGLTLKPGQIALFPNRFRDEEPGKNRPDLWGGANFGDDSTVTRVSGWLGKTRNGKAMITGETSYPRQADRSAPSQEVPFDEARDVAPSSRKSSRRDSGRDR